MKKILLILLIPVFCFAVNYTSTQSGEWSDVATWGGGGYPGDGDTATIAITHIVNVSDSQVVGTGGAAGYDELTVNGTLTFSLSGILVVKRDIRINGSVLANAWNFKLIIDGNYDIEIENSGVLSLIGEYGYPGYLMATSGNGFKIYDQAPGDSIDIYIDHMVIKRIGRAASTEGLVVHSNATASHLNIKNTFISEYYRFRFSAGFVPDANAVFLFDSCSFSDVRYLSGGISRYVSFEYSDANNFDPGTRGVTNSVFIGPVSGSVIEFGANFNYTNPVLFENNILIDVGIYADDGMKVKYKFAAANIRNTTVTTSSYHQFGYPQNAWTVDSSVIYCVYNNAHSVSLGAGTRTSANTSYFRDNIVFSLSYGSDQGNSISYGTEQQLVRNITIGGTGPYSALAGESGASILVDRHTHISVSGTYNEGALSIQESNVGLFDLTLRSCLLYGVNSTDEHIFDNLTGGSQPIVFTDYHNVYNIGGSDYNGTIVVGGGLSLNDSGYSKFDLNVDPQFIGSKFDSLVEQWDSINGGPGTVTNAFLKMYQINGFDTLGNDVGRDTNYTRSKLWDYCRLQCTPTNVLLRGSGFGGVDMGALDVSDLITIDSVTKTKKNIKFWTSGSDSLIVICSTFSQLHSIDTIRTDTNTVSGLCYGTLVNYTVKDFSTFTTSDTVRTIDYEPKTITYRRLARPDTIRVAYFLMSNKQDSCGVKYNTGPITNSSVSAYSYIGTDTTALTITTNPYFESGLWNLKVLKTEYNTDPNDTILEMRIDGDEIEQSSLIRIIHAQ